MVKQPSQGLSVCLEGILRAIDKGCILNWGAGESVERLAVLTDPILSASHHLY